MKSSKTALRNAIIDDAVENSKHSSTLAWPKQAGFMVEMRYLALRNFASHLERVKARADAGGHSASETTLRRIYEASRRNLRRAVLEMDILWVDDNTSTDANHPLVLEARNGEICFLADETPS